MKTKEGHYYDFGSRSLYQEDSDVSKKERDSRKIEFQQFVVPWQMNKTKKGQIRIE
ncbi:MAG: hypothetical protein R2757_09615 [Draconibacterium sp.]